MYIAHAIEDVLKIKDSHSLNSIVLTIGNFEGVHLGHQALLKHIKEVAEIANQTSIVLTFANHPSEILRPSNTTHHLITTEHKLKLFEEIGIDLTLLLTFTKDFSEQTAEEFLVNLRKVIPFKALILGHDAHFGKNREGDRDKVAALAKKLNFKLDYFPDYNYEGKRISSSQIRKVIQQGDLKTASCLLGRPYSIYGKVLHGNAQGSALGFPTANFSVDKLCLPPNGVYSAILKIKGPFGLEIHHGVANLGLAPTINKERGLFLEVHLFDKTIDLYEKTAEVELHTFIREEKRFDSLQSLKKQIAEDVIVAKNDLNALQSS